MEKFDSVKYKNEYTKANYDGISVVVPKGMKDEIKQKAVDEGKSLNQYIVEKILT